MVVFGRGREMCVRHRGLIALAVVLALAVFTERPANAQTFKVLHTFHKGKGPQSPSGALTIDTQGNLYGVAQGGTGVCAFNAPCGTVFKMTKTGKLVWVYSFPSPGRDGYDPTAGLLRDAKGNLFGVTLDGGVDTKACDDNIDRICGVVFKLDPTGKKETVLHRFTNNPDGEDPESLLIEDSAGNLYGTTLWGGSDFGTVFKMSQTGHEEILYTFPWPDFTDGAFAYSGVIRDAMGNLYGTADGGSGSGGCCGVVYKVDSSGQETVLYNFSGGSDGSSPSWEAPLIRDVAGNLYGTTGYGGNNIDICDGNEGCGVVFKLSPNSNGTWTDTTLYEFCVQQNCDDGHRPLGGLVRDSAGNLYGVTVFGGGSHSCNGGDCGVVFKLDTSGKETVLHAFTGGADGAGPEGRLVMDTAGNLYGTALAGGDLNCQPSFGGCGVVFKITP
jgi:uncharacterized repeat protein (TIGR03803 family)